MNEISTNLIKEAVYNLCFEANTSLDNRVYSKISDSYNKTENEETKNLLKNILQNAKTAYETKRPLCQDTGQVIVFLEIGQGIILSGEYIEKSINDAVSKCYKDNFFRKSVVNNAVFNRTNTNDNTPVIIYTKIIPQNEINVKVLIKGAGSENKSKLAMMLPSISENELIENIANMILQADENACPPMFIGIGIGATADRAMIMSKEALVSDNFSDNEINLANKIKNYINSKASEKYKNSYVLDIKLLTSSTHIASMPVCITINCHSDRISSAVIKNGKITYNHKKADFIEINNEKQSNIKEIYANDIDSLRTLNEGDEFYLTGEIYVARDAAHKRLIDLLHNNKPLPIEIKDKIIFYAGPCPNKPNEISGSIGPTTAGRMDNFATELYNKGLFASIGKGNRSKETALTIKKNKAKYFSVQGGIAALLAEKITKSEIIAFQDLGTEAIYKITVNKFPLKTVIA